MAVQLPEHYKETSVSNPNAIGNGITNASRTATKYITTIDSDNGIQVHAENIASTDYAQLDATGLDVVKASESIAKFGASARIGKASGAHMVQSPTETTYYEPDGTTQAMVIGLHPQSGEPRITLGTDSDYILVVTETSEDDGVVTYDEGLVISSSRDQTRHYGQIELYARGRSASTLVRITSDEVSGADVDITPSKVFIANGLSAQGEIRSENSSISASDEVSASDGYAVLKGSSTYIYLQETNTNAIRINKTTGTIQFYNGTSWVNLSYLPQSSDFTLSNATATAHTCRRSNNVATINVRGLKVSSSLASGSSVAIGTVPSGYRPTENVFAAVNTTTVANSWGLFVQISSAGTITLYNEASVALPTSAYLFFTATYVM